MILDPPMVAGLPVQLVAFPADIRAGGKGGFDPLELLLGVGRGLLPWASRISLAGALAGFSVFDFGDTADSPPLVGPHTNRWSRINKTATKSESPIWGIR